MKMRSSVPMILRMADEMKRLSMSSAFPAMFNSAFLDDPWAHLRAPMWNQLARLQKDEAVPKIGKNGYQVSLDVDGFKPNELSVKTINDNAVVIEGKSEQHEEDNGSFVSRHFIRKYALPSGFDATKAMSTLSSDGVLTINIPLPREFENAVNERMIPIQQTGPAHLNIKENPAVEQESHPPIPEDDNQEHQPHGQSDRQSYMEPPEQSSQLAPIPPTTQNQFNQHVHQQVPINVNEQLEQTETSDQQYVEQYPEHTHGNPQHPSQTQYKHHLSIPPHSLKFRGYDFNVERMYDGDHDFRTYNK